MFETKLKDTTATVFTEKGMFEILTASNVGLRDSGIFEGDHRYSYLDAISIIEKIDSALLSCPKYLRKRVTASREQFSFAFGPEMEKIVGPAPYPK